MVQQLPTKRVSVQRKAKLFSDCLWEVVRNRKRVLVNSNDLIAAETSERKVNSSLWLERGEAVRTHSMCAATVVGELRIRCSKRLVRSYMSEYGCILYESPVFSNSLEVNSIHDEYECYYFGTNALAIEPHASANT